MLTASHNWAHWQSRYIALRTHTVTTELQLMDVFIIK